MVGAVPLAELNGLMSKLAPLLQRPMKRMAKASLELMVMPMETKPRKLVNQNQRSSLLTTTSPNRLRSVCKLAVPFLLERPTRVPARNGKMLSNSAVKRKRKTSSQALAVRNLANVSRRRRTSSSLTAMPCVPRMNLAIIAVVDVAAVEVAEVAEPVEAVMVPVAMVPLVVKHAKAVKAAKVMKAEAVAMVPLVDIVAIEEEAAAVVVEAPLRMSRIPEPSPAWARRLRRLERDFLRMLSLSFLFNCGEKKNIVVRESLICFPSFAH